MASLVRRAAAYHQPLVPRSDNIDVEMSVDNPGDLSDDLDDNDSREVGTQTQPTRCTKSHPFILYITVLVASSAVLGLLIYLSERTTNSHSKHMILANDLFAAHDVFMVGDIAVFESPGSAGAAAVHASSRKLSQYVLELHPVAACRAALSSIQDEGDDVDFMAARGAAAWTCLPEHFTASDFANPFTAAAMRDPAAAHAARFPYFVADSGRTASLGACQGSKWQRTCSYWSLFHTMALRLEQVFPLETGTGLASSKFLPLLITTVAGGLTQCKG